MALDARRTLGGDLAALVAVVGSNLTSALPVTKLPAAADRRATYRLEFADGRTFKGRIAGAPRDAQRIERINRRLDPRYFTKVLARRGNALLEGWVEGAPLRPEQVSQEFLARCGQILAAVHRAGYPGLPRGSDVVAQRQVEIDRQLDRLAAEGLLGPRTRDQLLARARAARPKSAAVGIIHHDYCAENIVQPAPMQPVNVDNGSCRIGALDEDLARTWYRWPVSGDAFEAFLAGYWKVATRPPEPDAMPFWKIAAVVGSATDRLRARSDRLRFPLAVLDLLAADADEQILSLASLDASHADG